jgi:Putative zinc-finger
MSHDGSQPHPVEALSAFLDQETGAAERAEIETHLLTCPGCRALLEDLRRLDAAAEVGPPVPADLARRIRSRLGAAGAADADPGVTAAASATAPPKPPGRRWSAWIGPLPLAAAASLIVGGALWLLSPYRSSAPSGARESAHEERTLARNDPTRKDVVPIAPPGGGGKASMDTLQESAPRDVEVQKSGSASRETRERQESGDAGAATPWAPSPDAPPAAKSMRAARAQAAAPDDSLDQPAGGTPGGESAPADQDQADRATGGERSWPVWIDARPFRVVLNSETAMVVSQGSMTCAVSIDPADGRRLIHLAAAERSTLVAAAPSAGAPTPPSAAAPPAAQGGATAPAPAPATAGRPLSPAGEEALRLIRGRYRAQVLEHCVPLLN